MLHLPLVCNEVLPLKESSSQPGKCSNQICSKKELDKGMRNISGTAQKAVLFLLQSATRQVGLVLSDLYTSLDLIDDD